MIPKEWLIKQGDGAVVGIVDTGIKRSLNCFNNTKITHKDFGQTEFRHGTHVASTIVQFSPKASIIFAAGTFESYEKLEEMLEWISCFKLDVLNLSLSFNQKNDKIEEILKKIQSNGTIIIAAFNSRMTYPCKYPFILKAGKGGDFEAPEEWISYFPSGHKGTMKGSSVATAITSGLCSLGKAIIPTINKEDFLSIVKPEDVFFDKIIKKQVNVNL